LRQYFSEYSDCEYLNSENIKILRKMEKWKNGKMEKWKNGKSKS